MYCLRTKCKYICYNNSNKQNQKDMAKVFKAEVLEKMKSDADLFALVAKEMDVKPSSLIQIIYRNGNNINQYSIVKLVADYMKKDPEDLLEEETEPETVNK